MGAIAKTPVNGSVAPNHGVVNVMLQATERPITPHYTTLHHITWNQ